MNHSFDPEALRSVLERSGLHFKVNSQSYILGCPRCGKAAKLYVRKHDGRSRCMKCGPDFSGWADFILSETLDVPRQELRQTLYGDSTPAGTDIVIESVFADHWSEFGYEDDETSPSDTDELPTLVWSPDIVDIDHPHAIRGAGYLAGRGINLDLARRYGLRYNPIQRRVVFPIVVDGELKGWQARAIGPTEWLDEDGNRISIPKMLTVGKLGGKALMFQDHIVGDYAVMVEGPIDAIHSHLCGNVVATMGKGVTSMQLEILVSKGVNKLWVGLDPDAAEDISRITREMVDKGVKCYRLDPPQGFEDLGAAPPESILEQFRERKPLHSGMILHYFAR